MCERVSSLGRRPRPLQGVNSQAGASSWGDARSSAGSREGEGVGAGRKGGRQAKRGSWTEAEEGTDAVDAGLAGSARLGRQSPGQSPSPQPLQHGRRPAPTGKALSLLSWCWVWFQ